MSLLTFPWPQLLDSNGDTYPGAKMYFYQTGTSTLASVFTDVANQVPHPNPVVANAQGVFPPIRLANREYRVVLTDAADVTLYTADPVSSVETFIESNAVQLTGAQTVDGLKTFVGGVAVTNPFLIGGQAWSAPLNNDFFVTYSGLEGSPDNTTIHTGFGFGDNSVGVTLAARNNRFHVRTTDTLVNHAWHELYHTGNFDPAGTVSPDLNDTWVPTVYTGFSVNPGQTFSYRKVGNVVTMRVQAASYGTTNGANITMGTLPAALRPSSGRIIHVPALMQISSFGNQRVTAQMIINTNGSIEIQMPINFTEGANSFPRYIADVVSDKTWILDNSENFTYTI